jgi:hypothetical protein
LKQIMDYFKSTKETVQFEPKLGSWAWVFNFSEYKKSRNLISGFFLFI